MILTHHPAEGRSLMKYLNLRQFSFFVAILTIFSLFPATDWPVAYAEDAYPRSNPLVGDQAAIEKGAYLYFKWCGACHGRRADGEGVRFTKGADLTIFWRSYCDYMVIALNGRTDKNMPPWGGVLDEEELSSIGAYLETLAKESANWKGSCTLL